MKRYGVGALFLALAWLAASCPGFPLVFGAEIRYDSAGRRDPFVPLVGPDGLIMKKSARADFVIEGIIFDSEGGSMVIVNGKVYRPGDTVDGAIIVQIYQDRVLLAQEEEQKTVWLREEIAEEGEKPL